MGEPHQIAHYRISSKLGEGGMGAVYRATDTRLARDVAIKVLPSAFAHDPARLARFTREAKALAALNHPNIAAIYSVEDGAIVMELIDGDDLCGPLPLPTAIAYAVQIAEALEAAHEKGITHRDLKPANIKVTPDGVVKLLDFGLATAVEEPAAQAAAANTSPTLSVEMTRAGMILGTASYMAPEQAAGKPVDKRADIWSFGVVFFEMLTGRRLFAGDSIADTLADVLRAPIDLDALPAGTPPRVRELLRRCLDRNVKTRLRDIGEARVLLAEPLAASPAPAARPARSLALWAMAAVVALAVPAVWFLKPVPDQPLLQLEVEAPPGVSLGPPTWGQVQVSPDGNSLVFAGRDAGGVSRLWLRSLGAGGTTAIPGTEGGTIPYWSPDSRHLLFHADNKVKRLELATLRIVDVCDASTSAWTVWMSSGLMVFADLDRILNKVSADGGTPTPMFALSVLPAGSAHTPQTLPDGYHFLFQRPANPSKMIFASMDGKVLRTWDTNIGPASPGAPARFASAPGRGGWLLSHRVDSRLVAHKFDPRTGDLSGDEILIAHDVPQGPSWSTSDTGVLAYRSLRGFNAVRKLTWVDRAGVPGEVIGEAGEISRPRISHSRKQVLYTRDNVLFVYDTVRKTATRMTQASASSAFGVWLPDDSGVYYATGARMGSVVALHRFDTAVDKTFALPQEYVTLEPTDISPDGKWMAAANLFTGASRIVILPLDSGKLVRKEELPIQTFHGTFSPDGRWLLYSAMVNSRRDIYVRPSTPDGRGPWQISPAGGDQPAWSGDGKEIVYLAPNGVMTAIHVETAGGSIRPGAPTSLFPSGLAGERVAARDYDVTPDGKHFLIPVTQAGTAVEAPITVIVNWPKLLERK
jgi:eukaryotic-like serine/threonine-protein kinase